MASIAIVEDEKSLQEDLKEYLTSCGHIVTGHDDAISLDKSLKTAFPDVVIIDVNLPGEDGFSIARRLREQSDLGIIFLTARGINVDRVIGLEIGADAYLVKPIDFRELEAQIRTLLRRLRPSPSVDVVAALEPEAITAVPPQNPTDAKDAWVFESVGWKLCAPNGTSLKLTATERIFVSLVVANPGEPVSRSEIFRALGKREWDAGDRSVDSMVRRLRAKTSEICELRLPIEAVHGTGYAFTAPVIIR